jgi:hypothetical protein
MGNLINTATSILIWNIDNSILATSSFIVNRLAEIAKDCYYMKKTIKNKKPLALNAPGGTV